MFSKKKQSNSRSKIISFFAKIIKTSDYIKELIISQSTKLFFNNYSLRAITKKSEGTYWRVADYYWLNNLYAKVK